jgi:N-acetylmuramoyl-L-alanine amidase
VSLLFLAACSEPERPRLSAETLPPVTEDGDVAALVAEEQAEAEIGEQEVGETAGRPRVLITPTGVVVPIVSNLTNSYSVLTPCGNRARVTWGTPIAAADVVLDPGHGGAVETGAVGPNGLTEKELNLDLAKRTARLLEGRGFTVVLTRTADYRVPLSTRAGIANVLGAKAIVSIHHNAPTANTSTTPGTEVFIQDGSVESARLGGLIQEEVVDALEQFDLTWSVATDAGAIVVLNDSGDNAYGMIRRPDMPAVLAELGYISNAPEAELFATDQYRRVASAALADGIERWLTTDDPGSGFRDEPRLFTPSGGTGGSEGCVDPDLG